MCADFLNLCVHVTVCIHSGVYFLHLKILACSLYRRLPESAKHISPTAIHYKAEIQEDVYEEPDKLRVITTTVQLGNFELTDCPAYVPTASNLQTPHTATETQSSDYEL